VQITITGRHVSIGDEIKQYAREKAEKLLKFFDRIQAIEVVIDHEGEEFTVEMIVNAGARNEFVASEIGADTQGLIDLTIDKLERQLTRHKERWRDRRHINKKPSAPELE